MSRLSKEEKRYLMYQIYSWRHKDPWIANKKIARLTGHSISTVNRYARKAQEKEVIWDPELRLRPHPERKIALLLFDNKYKVFNELADCPGITFFSVYQGGWDILAIYDEPVDFTTIQGYGGAVVRGIRRKIFSPKVSYTTFEESILRMENYVKKKPTEESRIDYNPSRPDWDEEEWTLFHYFNENLRISFSKLRKEHPISWRKYEKWKKSLFKYCTVTVNYFPEGYNAYDSVTSCFKTDYEQYIVDLFSLMPASPIFYGVKDYLMANLWLPKNLDLRLRFFAIISDLIDMEGVYDYIDGHGVFHWIVDKY